MINSYRRWDQNVNVIVATVVATYVIESNAIEYVEQTQFSSTGKYFKYPRNFNTYKQFLMQ